MEPATTVSNRTWAPDPTIQIEPLRDPLGDLTKDLASLCFTDFSARKLCRYRLVSKKWNEITGCHELWANKFFDQFGPKVLIEGKTLNRDFFHSLLLEQNAQVKEFQEGLDKNLFLRDHQRIPDAYIVELCDTFPLNNRFCSQRQQFSVNLLSILAFKIPHLTEFSSDETKGSFSVPYAPFINTTEKEDIQFTSLKRLRILNIKFVSDFPKWANHLNEFTKDCTKLKSFEIRMDKIGQHSFINNLIETNLKLNSLKLNVYIQNLDIEKIGKLQKLNCLSLKEIGSKKVEVLCRILPGLKNLTRFESPILLPTNKIETFLSTIAKMKSLKFLSIRTRSLKECHFVQLLTSIPNVTELSLFEFREESLKHLLDLKLNYQINDSENTGENVSENKIKNKCICLAPKLEKIFYFPYGSLKRCVHILEPISYLEQGG